MNKQVNRITVPRPLIAVFAIALGCGVFPAHAQQQYRQQQNYYQAPRYSYAPPQAYNFGPTFQAQPRYVMPQQQQWNPPQVNIPQAAQFIRNSAWALEGGAAYVVRRNLWGQVIIQSFGPVQHAY